MCFGIKDGFHVCPKCLRAAGLNNQSASVWQQTSLAEIKGRIQAKKTELTVTHSVGGVFMLDENQGLWYAQKPGDRKGRRRGPLHSVEDIIGFELLEDNNVVMSGGGGSALAGGLVFGPVGAVVGASVGKRRFGATCTSLRIKVVLNSIDLPVDYITLLDKRTPVRSPRYKQAFNDAQQILGILKVMEQRRVQAAESKRETATKVIMPALPTDVDKLRDYKLLMDEGVISEDEFEQKKRQILGIA